MSESIPSSRRKFFKVGIGSVGAIVAAKSIASQCLGDATAAQPKGPFFPNSGTPEDVIREDSDPTTPLHLANDNDLTFIKGRNGIANGQVVYVKGKILDGACRPIPNATLVIWQASSSGRYNHTGDEENRDFIHPLTGELISRVLDPSFQYWGRAQTNAQGEYYFKSIVPGFYPADLSEGWYRPPHIHFMVSALGFPQFVTQLYFRGSEIRDNDFIQELNKKDFLLQNEDLNEGDREGLIVDFETAPTGKFQDGLVGEFDIKLKR